MIEWKDLFWFRFFVIFTLLIYYQMKIHMAFELVGQSMRVDYLLVWWTFLFTLNFGCIQVMNTYVMAMKKQVKSGRKNQSEWYGERYSVDDTITCYAVSYISFQLEWFFIVYKKKGFWKRTWKCSNIIFKKWFEFWISTSYYLWRNPFPCTFSPYIY